MFHNVQKCVVLLPLGCVLCVAALPPVWLDVPFVKQEPNGCGAASVAMVMQYWQGQHGGAADKGAEASEIKRVLYSEKAHGIYASDLERYLGQHEFLTFAFRGEWHDLEQQLEKGRPLIVALQPKYRAAERHYVVVTGLDGERKLVFTNDPAERKLLKREWSRFEREWKGTGNWTLLAIPREEQPSVH